MNTKYQEYKQLDLPNVANEVLEDWKKDNVFKKSIDTREGKKPFVFYEGPPSANGLPGIHHVMARAIKDIFCRYKTLKGFQVNRKAGWDTHGLPVELGVEKALGITKEDIGSKISVDEYNQACKDAVMKYTDIWNDLTEKMGYWVDMENPYVTYKSKYMETVWWLLNQLFEKDLIYKGYTIQPYSPKAGTGLSSHEINQPGCYRDVTDTTIVAQFKVAQDSLETLNSLFDEKLEEAHLLAWTTTPWTLPSNTALTVGPKIEYVLVKSFNQYTKQPVSVVLAKNLVSKQFNKSFFAVETEGELADFKVEDKKIPFFVTKAVLGSDLVGLKYEQLLEYALPYENPEDAFRVISGDFVTIDDGTGIVHTAPTFGADDAKVANDAGVPGMLVLDANDNPVPLVDLQGKFLQQLPDVGGMYVKNEYYDDNAPDKSADVLIAIKLKEENKAFKVEKYVHSYPHCWRTDKPVLYYPLDSWFIKSTAAKDRMIALNKTINWKPESTGTGRFGNWLENLNDWNLSRSRYWGIPIPIWSSEDGTERKSIGSIEQLIKEIDLSIEKGFMTENPYAGFEIGNMSDDNYDKVDLHKHIVDGITLVSASGNPMKREADLIDVWFDSGSMPYAQLHYPFENKELIDEHGYFPADFIAEGVDQTRGWFFTLHAIATMVFDNVAYKNVISNGLVLDKNGQKMSKRLGNAAEPFETLATYGPDATRWYMITNAQPWDNLKFDLEGITEVQRKFFRALHNMYSFFSLYANIDGFEYKEADFAIEDRPEIDQWILSKLNSLIKNVDEAYNSFEPTKAGRLIQEFTVDNLSNWYVRLCRRRFWKGEYSEDKISAYQTLYTCLTTVAKLASPIAPFYADRLYKDLNKVTNKESFESVHLSNFPAVNESLIDIDLEERNGIAQKVSSMILSLRKREQIKVRQPLQKVMVPVLDEVFAKRLASVQDIILSEVNVKELELLYDTTGVLVKKIKPNFKSIGPKYGKQMKVISKAVNQFTQEDIALVEKNNGWKAELDGVNIELEFSDFEISTDDIPGWLVYTEGAVTVALDITISEDLKNEGLARELVNRIQNYRKESGLEITDKILVTVDANEQVQQAVSSNKHYISSEILATDIVFNHLNQSENLVAELEEGIQAVINIQKN